MSVYNFTRSVLHCSNFERVLSAHGFIAARNFKDKPIKSNYELKKAKIYESMPKVPMLPFIGSAWAYFPLIGRYSVQEMHKADIHKNKTYGPLVREKFGSFEVVTSYSHEVTHYIMGKDGEYPSRGDFATLKAYRLKRKELYNPAGLLISEGKEWSDLRKSVEMYLMKDEYYEHYLKLLNAVAADFTRLIGENLDEKKEVDNAVSLLNKWSLEALGCITLKRRFGCLNPSASQESDGIKIINALETQLSCMNKMEASAGNIPFWKFFPTFTWLKFVKASDVFTSLLFNYIARTTLEHDFKEFSGQPSLLQYLTSEQVGISAAMVIITDLMMAGIDTTSYAASFFLYNLAKYPYAQERVLEEIKRFLPNDKTELTFQKYENMEYIKVCLKESMRLHPIARGHVRILKEDMTVDGYTIPAGTAVICAVQVINRNPYLFRDPDGFDPIRWDEMILFDTIPFGYGRRSCVGSRLAEMEILTMVIKVLRHYSVEYHYEDIGMRTRLINSPDRPLKLRFRRHVESRSTMPQ